MPCSKIVGLVVTPERPSSAISRASSPSSSSALRQIVEPDRLAERLDLEQPVGADRWRGPRRRGRLRRPSGCRRPALPGGRRLHGHFSGPPARRRESDPPATGRAPAARRAGVTARCSADSGAVPAGRLLAARSRVCRQDSRRHPSRAFQKLCCRFGRVELRPRAAGRTTRVRDPRAPLSLPAAAAIQTPAGEPRRGRPARPTPPVLIPDARRGEEPGHQSTTGFPRRLRVQTSAAGAAGAAAGEPTEEPSASQRRTVRRRAR